MKIKKLKSKKHLLILSVCIIIVVGIISEIFFTSIIYNTANRNTIRVAADPCPSSSSYYYEVRPNRTLISSTAKIKRRLTPNISSIFFKPKWIEKQVTKLTEEEYEEILSLANKAIENGDIDYSKNNMFFSGGVVFGLYYKGVSQKTIIGYEGYDDLNELFFKIIENHHPHEHLLI